MPCVPLRARTSRVLQYPAERKECTHALLLLLPHGTIAGLQTADDGRAIDQPSAR